MRIGPALSLAASGLALFCFAGGKVVEFYEYFDTAKVALAAAG